MASTITCPATATLTEHELTTLSRVFPCHARAQLIDLRRVLNNRGAAFRVYASGVVTFNEEAMLQEVTLKCSAKTAERVAILLNHGICLQAVASVHLSIPLTGSGLISLRV